MKLTDELIKRKTTYGEMEVRTLKKNLEKFEKDIHQKERVRALLCKNCFYLDTGFAGQAFTRYECKNCENEQMHHNTDVPKYCPSCAEKHACCVRCASSI